MKSLKIGIIGGGFTGLSAAYYLSKKGHEVTLIESSDHLGGLAAGFRHKTWDWSLEEHYHHWFTNDHAILGLAKEIHFPVTTYRPKTSILSKGKMYQFDSPISLLKFPHLGMIDKFRTATLMAFLKLVPFWKYLEEVTAKKFLIRWGGMSAWDKLWGPLFEGKFGKYSDKIPSIWFWARIKKRTPSLAYPDGGYRKFIDRFAESINRSGAEILLETSVGSIERKNRRIAIETQKSEQKNELIFDKVVCTLPTHIFSSITKSLRDDYLKTLKPLKGLGAVTLILSLKENFFQDNTYWLNINEKGFPFLAVVEHTNMVGSDHYGGEHLLYIGNYLEVDHEYFEKSADQLLDEFEEYLQKINPKFKKSLVKSSYVFKTKFAQPIVPLNYSKSVPFVETPIEGLYLANMQQVYPWDRGTNYAVELGRKTAKMIINS